MKTNDGGPAFPNAVMGKEFDYVDGMSLRDWFAGMAMALHWVSDSSRDESTAGWFDTHVAGRIAGRAYIMADAMLEARKVTS